VRKRYGTVLAGVFATVAALAATVVAAQPASAHGAMTVAGSRTFLCYEDGLTSTGEIVPRNPACQAAVARAGTTPLYNWFAVGNRSGATSGGTSGFIPDGKLCSGNSNYYDFSGFDLARGDWPKTHLTAGSSIQIRYNKWAAHPGTWRLYITKSTWDPTQPLTWAEMQTAPFSTVTDPPSVGSPGSVDSYYYWNATLPAGLTGYHIIYSVWARSDSSETFYGCSDVVFDGGSGEVTGIGSTAPPPTTTPCRATYTVTNSWPGGFQAQVTVANPTTSTMYGWTVTWVTPDGQTINSAWNGSLSQAGSLATMKNAGWNSVLAPSGSTSFGFTANYPASPVVPTGISCQSP
jgi:predicted carbohydrate-binding protein with CBM5 and CBM33 domain